MAFFDELKKNLSEVSGAMIKTSESVAKKSGKTLEIQKSKLKKVSLENDRKNLYAKLGELYFEHYADGDMPSDMALLCEKITACQHAINEAEERAAILKGVVICSSCQSEVDKDASYCPKCGAEIVHVVEDDDDDVFVDEDSEACEAASEDSPETVEGSEEASEGDFAEENVTEDAESLETDNDETVE